MKTNKLSLYRGKSLFLLISIKAQENSVLIKIFFLTLNVVVNEVTTGPERVKKG
jgi:hypothetical protein